MSDVKAPRRTKEEMLLSLQEKLAEEERKSTECRDKLQARIEKIAARGSTQDRKDDTRRKILLGAMLQSRVQKRKHSQSKIDEWMGEFLTRDEDRTFFGLTTIDNNVTTDDVTNEIIDDAKGEIIIDVSGEIDNLMATLDGECPKSSNESTLETLEESKSTDKFDVNLMQLMDHSVAQDLVTVLSHIIGIGLEKSQEFAEIAKSRDVQILQNVEFCTAVEARDELGFIGCTVEVKQV